MKECPSVVQLDTECGKRKKSIGVLVQKIDNGLNVICLLIRD